METDLVIRLITEFRDDMNRRFERMEQRSDHRFDQLELKLMREIGKVNERLTEEVLWGRREIKHRLDRCEREIEDLKKRNGS
jgi:hypothetical protein